MMSKKYKVVIYKDANGKSELINYLLELKDHFDTSKDARVNYKKIIAHIHKLQEKGLALGQPAIKHVKGDVWELRPLKNRILFFMYEQEKIVLLHYFIKKTRKTPKREIEKAEREMKDYRGRMEKES